MPGALVEVIASSSAHGISKAAGARARPLKVMWVLLFLAFLALFFKGGFNLVMKFRESRLTKDYHMDQVQFAFPDLYFCPSNAYSGSYPFMLKKHEADRINKEISSIIRKQKMLFTPFGIKPSAYSSAKYAQASLPFHLFAQHLVQRKEQAVLYAKLTSNYVSYGVELETFYHPENLVCFKVLLSEELKRLMQSMNSVLEIWLSTDPYFSDFNFTGYPIDPITGGKNKSVSFLSWHPIRLLQHLKMSGYTMLIVSPGAYPSLKFENNFHIATGNAYSVKLEMLENACSAELHKTHCVANQPQVAFTNPLTEQPELFNYSSAACYYMRRNLKYIEMFECQMSLCPLLWEYHSWPRCLNVSELTLNTVTKMISTEKRDLVAKIEADVVGYCKNRVPCVYSQYGASFSFSKWPTVGSSTAQYFATSVPIDEVEAPGLAKLVMIARQMQSGNHSAHLEGIFRSYVSESMVSVSISAAASMSSQVVLTWSYSFTDFLADTGGLLGLYIGCSMLTLCELLELMYILVEQIYKRRSQPNATSGEAEAAGDDVAKEAAPALESEMEA